MIKRATNHRINNNNNNFTTSPSRSNGSIVRNGVNGRATSSIGFCSSHATVWNIILLLLAIPLAMTGLSVLHSIHSTRSIHSSTPRLTTTTEDSIPYEKINTRRDNDRLEMDNEFETRKHELQPQQFVEHKMSYSTDDQSEEHDTSIGDGSIEQSDEDDDDEGDEVERNNDADNGDTGNEEENEEEYIIKEQKKGLLDDEEGNDDDDVDEDDNEQLEENEDEEENESDLDSDDEEADERDTIEETEVSLSEIAETDKEPKLEESKESEKNGGKRIQKPEIVWLASYPNSGTSYTMTLVERGSNRSTASNYGLEVTPPTGSSSIPVHSNHPEGPYWEGHKNAKKMKHTIRDLPDDYVLTKTHCGGRCIKCPATEYVVKNTNAFTAACQRSTSIDRSGHATEHVIATSRIKKLVHLIRNPIDNTVSRYHLERKHLIRNDYKLYNTKYPLNFTGFQKWCRDVERKFSDGKEETVIPSATIRNYMKKVPCGAEFYKFAQWHNLLLETIPKLGGDDDDFDKDDHDDIPVLTLYYEDYHKRFNETATKLFRFVNQEIVRPLREFRSLPDYQDHYTTKQLGIIHDLVKRVSSAATWDLVHHYFDQFLSTTKEEQILENIPITAKTRRTLQAI